MDQRASIDARVQARDIECSTSPEDPMNTTAPLTFLGDQSLWSEDVVWLTENRAWYVLGHLTPRIRWLHVYVEEAPGGSGVLARIQLDLAGQDLCSVCAIRTCPQAALCAAFDLLHQEIQRDELVAV
jgi:hypothetical protein